MLITLAGESWDMYSGYVPVGAEVAVTCRTDLLLDKVTMLTAEQSTLLLLLLLS
jgi:hypothetical protein